MGTSSCLVAALRTGQTWSHLSPARPCPACPQDWWESQTACVVFYCGLLFCFLAGKKKTLTSMKTHVWAARPNRKGGYIGYSMTCVSRSRCIWSFKSFCLKDLVLRGGTVYDTLAGPLINWNQFFKGNHKSPFLFPSCRATLMAPFKVGLSTFFHHYC